MKETKSGKKIVAIIVTVLVCIFFVLSIIIPGFNYVFGHNMHSFEGVFVVFQVLLGVGLILCMFHILKQRITDLNNGQEDDLDKY